MLRQNGNRVSGEFAVSAAGGSAEMKINGSVTGRTCQGQWSVRASVPGLEDAETASGEIVLELSDDGGTITGHALMPDGTRTTWPLQRIQSGLKAVSGAVGKAGFFAEFILSEAEGLRMAVPVKSVTLSDSKLLTWRKAMNTPSRYCRQCGTALAVGSRFCTKCGRTMKEPGSGATTNGTMQDAPAARPLPGVPTAVPPSASRTVSDSADPGPNRFLEILRRLVLVVGVLIAARGSGELRTM